ncbi:MAG: aminoacyl-tRNA hydrolase [Rhodothermia bacterium]|nr:MAG: aminoacyl-tRNA hydrolase [Rhodothermia bacterium]
MASSKRLIVGLGNPGEAYSATRHNVGFMVIDDLAERLRLPIKTKGSAILGWGKWKGYSVGLAKPTTYMNRSGTAVEEMMRKNRLGPEDLLVIVDDINLPVGKVRIRERGGPGGHNGLEDIIDWLDSDQFPRLRIGVGSEYEKGRQVDFVLSDFVDEEKELIDQAINIARDAALTFVSDGIVTMMNRFST